MGSARDLLKTMTPLEAFQALTKLRKDEQKPKKPKKAKPQEPTPEPVVPWSEKALAWIGATVSGREFTSDDLVTAIGSPPDGNGIGNLFRDASKKGLITDTGNTVASSSPKARGRRIRVWRSV